MLLRPEHPLSWLKSRARDAATTIAIRDDQGEISYGELWRALGEWHSELTDAGLIAGQALAVLTRDRRRMVRALWLALYAGCPVMPLDPQRPSTVGLIDELGIGQVLTEPGTAPASSRARQLPATVFDSVPTGESLPPVPGSVDDPQLLITTSGTEGKPKAIMLGAAGLAASAATTCQLFDLNPGDRWLCCLPVIHVGGLLIMFRCARAGATVELRQHFDPAAVWADIRAGTTHTSLSPIMLHCILDAAAGAAAPADLRHVLMGGSTLPRSLATRAAGAGWPLTETYGMSETATHIAVVEPDSRGLRPVAGCEIDLVDLGAGAGEPGRLRLAGPTIMLGYANPALKPGDGLDGGGGLLTADLGRRLENGLIRVVGREDDVIICGGLNIHPAEVEQLLAAGPGIGEVAVTGRPDPVWGQQLVALHTGDIAAAALSDWASRHLPGRFRPRLFKRVAELPKNAMGKLRRDRLGSLVGETDPAAE